MQTVSFDTKTVSVGGWSPLLVSLRWQWWTPENSLYLPNSPSHIDDMALVPWSQHYAFFVGHPLVEVWVYLSELLIHILQYVLLFLSSTVGESFKLVQHCPCRHSKVLNRWSLHVEYNNVMKFKFLSTSLPSQELAAGEKYAQSCQRKQWPVLHHWDQEMARESHQHCARWRTGQSMYQ